MEIRTCRSRQIGGSNSKCRQAKAPFAGKNGLSDSNQTLNPFGKRDLAFSILDFTLLSKTVTLNEYQKRDQNAKAVQCKTGECNFVPLSSSPGRSTYLLLVAVYCCHDVTLM